MPKYIEKRRRRWYAVLDVPKDLLAVVGKKRLVQSLGTESKTEAERLVLPVVARWKTEFEALRTGDMSPLDKAKMYREDLERAKEEAEKLGRSEAAAVETNYDIGMEILDEEARKIAAINHDLGEKFYLLASGRAVDLEEHVETWLSSLDNEPKTIAMKRRDVTVLVGNFRFSHEVQKKSVQRWVRGYQSSKALADATMGRMVSAWKGYWSYLQYEEILDRDDNPFDGILIKPKKKSSSKHNRKKGWEPFTPADVAALLHAATLKRDHQLCDVIEIAMWTGCRIEEVCSLRVDHVHSDFIEIVGAKSAAGDRKVPIHSRLNPLLQRLCKESTDGFVISGLNPTKYGKRSDAVGKRFGRLKDSLGHGRNHVFHSIRKTVATLLENAGVPENVSADILGHEKQTMTYGLYSGGSGLGLMREAIQKLEYPELVKAE